MAIISSVKRKITDFFDFASGKLKFELTDMITDTSSKEAHMGDFLETKGVYVYSTNFIVNVQLATKMNVAGLKFEIFTKDPIKYPVLCTEKDALDAFQVLFEMPVNTIQSGGSSKSSNNSKIVIEENSIIKVLAAKNSASAVGIALSIPVQYHHQETTFKHASQEAKINGQDPAMLAAVGLYSAISPISAISLDSKNNSASLSNKNSQSSARNNGTQGSLSEERGLLRSRRQGNQNNPVVKSIETDRNSGKKPAPVSYFDFLPIKKEYKHNLEIEKHDIAEFDYFYVKIG